MAIDIGIGSIDFGATFMIVGVVIAVMGAGVMVILRNLDTQFPKIDIDERYRGMRLNKTYRLLGTSIVSNNLIQILLNNFTYYGDQSTLTWSAYPNGKKIYDAIRRYDYLVGTSTGDRDVEELLKTRPKIILDMGTVKSIGGKEIPASATMETADYVLSPIKFEYTNEIITEKPIKSGKDIITLYLQNTQNTEAYIKASNPIIAVIISTIPLIVISAIILIIIWLAFNSMTTAMNGMTEASKILAEALASR